MAKTKETNICGSWQIACAAMEKEFGSRFFTLGSKEVVKTEVIPTGSISLDIALGTFGWPRGRIIEIWGEESSSKTTLILNALAQAQKHFPDKQALLVDFEQSFDHLWAMKNGIQDGLSIVQPDYAEQGLNAVERAASTGRISLIAIDSITSLVPKSEYEGVIGDQHIGLQARLMSQFCRKIVPILNKTGTILICSNQIRYKIVQYGNPETTGGGNALKFFASMRVRTKRASKSELITEGSKIIGENITAEVKKNKLAPPFGSAVIPILYERGISGELDLLDAAAEVGVIGTSGAWYVIPTINQETGEVTENKIQGRISAAKLLEDKQVFDSIYQEVKVKRTRDTKVLEEEDRNE